MVEEHKKLKAKEDEMIMERIKVINLLTIIIYLSQTLNYVNY